MTARPERLCLSAIEAPLWRPHSSGKENAMTETASSAPSSRRRLLERALEEISIGNPDKAQVYIELLLADEKVAHTPGPWSQDPDSTGTVSADKDGLFIAETETEDRPFTECRANARLIAATPELFAFIQQIARMTMDGEPVSDGNDIYSDFEMDNDDAVATLNRLIEEARRLEARAKGDAAESNATGLPPDPEGKNDDRAKWAAAAIRHYQRATRTDWHDAVADLLCDLMHFCDRENFNFDKKLDRARMHYKAETTEGGAA
jgi:hypothetical protein